MKTKNIIATIAVCTFASLFGTCTMACELNLQSDSVNNNAQSNQSAQQGTQIAFFSKPALSITLFINQKLHKRST